MSSAMNEKNLDQFRSYVTQLPKGLRSEANRGNLKQQLVKMAVEASLSWTSIFPTTSMTLLAGAPATAGSDSRAGMVSSRSRRRVIKARRNCWACGWPKPKVPGSGWLC